MPTKAPECIIIEQTINPGAVKKRIKLLIVEDDERRRSAMLDIFDRVKPGGFDLIFRSCESASGLTGAGPAFDVAMVDFSNDPNKAAHAAWRVRSMNGEAGIAVIAPSPEFPAPVEVVELGLGPLIVWDEDGLASLPSVAAAMVEGASAPNSSISAQSLLKLRNQELRDITDGLARQSVHLIRLRNELAAEKSKMETVINGMTDAMAYFDIEGRLEIANPVAMALFPSLTADGQLGDAFLDTLKQNAPSNEKARDEPMFDTIVGDRVFRVRPSQVHDAEGNEAGLLILLTDITRDKEYERLKSDFTSMISHELRTPLTSIGAAVDNFLSGALGSVNEKQLKFLEIIKRNVERQQALVDDLLDLAKFEAGQMDLVIEKTNLPALVSSSVEQFSLAFRDKNIHLEFATPLELSDIRVDQRLVTQAVNNLLSNALKFTAEGGRVSVSVTPSGGWAVIAVEDTGIGVPRDQLSRIFDKYTQIDSSTRRRYSGTGLGLAVVREIVTSHGGKATVDSEPGKGSVFKIFLPTRED